VKVATKSSLSSTTLLWLSIVWLVMQVVAPAYHHHSDVPYHSATAPLQWQAPEHAEHECYLCSLHYSPSSPEVQAIDVFIPEDTDTPCSRDSLLIPLRVIGIPSVRAPPTA